MSNLLSYLDNCLCELSLKSSNIVGNKINDNSDSYNIYIQSSVIYTPIQEMSVSYFFRHRRNLENEDPL